MSVPYFRFYPTDFEADTSHLSMIEDGAYNRLLRLCWMTPGCSLPDDEAWIFRRCRAHSEADKEAVRAVLDEFFTCEKQRVFSARLMREFEHASNRRDVASKNGRLGGRPKTALKINEKDQSNGLANEKLKKANQNQNQNQNILEDTSVSSLSSADDAKPFDEIAEAVSAYNIAAEESGWPKVAVLSKARRAALAARMREAGGIAGWQAALAKAQASDMCCGQNQRGWVANFDFLTRQSSFAKLMEGNYDNRTPKHSADHAGRSGPHSGMVAAFAEVAARKSGRT